MPYLIDGHNLIPYIPGLSLQDLDDEIALIKVLQEFASQHKTRLEVYFDQAPAGQAGSRSFGSVRAHFVRQDSTADRAIINRLKRMGKDAKNWTVVTSDREILVEAKSAHSTALKSDQFAAQLRSLKSADSSTPGKGDSPEVTDGEVDYWLGQFQGSDD
jgi:predicted RNA-binding protein with PIN domain